MWRSVKSMRRSLVVAGLALVLIFSLAGSVFAVDVRSGANVLIGPDEVIHDDLILSGATVIVDGTIDGDLVATGNKVTINGTVNGSLVFLGQTLALNGKVGGSVYSAGAVLTVGPTATVDRNLFFAGYSYTSASGSVIRRDNLIAGYQGVFDGQIGRNLLAALGALELNGRVEGDVIATVDRPDTGTPFVFPMFFGFDGQQLPPALPAGVRVGPEAKIVGTFTYTSPADQARAIQARPEGGIVFSTPVPAPAEAGPVVATPPRDNAFLNWLWPRLREIVSLLLIAGLLLWLMPVSFEAANELTRAHPILAGAWGFVVVLVGYIGATALAVFLILLVAGLSAVTLGGLALTAFGVGFSSLSLLFSLFSVLVAYVSKLVVLYAVSHSLLDRTLPQWNRYALVTVFLGIVVFVLLRAIPWVGPVLSFVVTLIGLGAIWLLARSRFTKAGAPLQLAHELPAM